MQATKETYSAYEAMAFTERQLIREFHHWRAICAVDSRGQLVIVLEEYVRRCATICVYTTRREQEQDIKVLREMSENPPFPPPNRDGGTGASAIAAWLWEPRRLAN